MVRKAAYLFLLAAGLTVGACQSPEADNVEDAGANATEVDADTGAGVSGDGEADPVNQQNNF